MDCKRKRRFESNSIDFMTAKRIHNLMAVGILAICIGCLAFHCSAEELTTNVWGPPTNNLMMSITARSGNLKFTVDGVMDVSGFIQRFSGQSDPVSAFLWKSLSKDEQLLLANYQAAAPTANQAQEIAVQALNRIMAGPLIYSWERFKGISLDGPTQFNVSQPTAFGYEAPPSPYVSHFNRVLLEDAYPLQLSRKPPSSHPVIKISEPVELTILMKNVSTNDTFYIRYGAGWGQPYSYLVVKPSGKETSFRQPGDRGRSGTSHPLALHQDRVVTVNFSEIFEFDEIGIYTIIVQREMGWHFKEKKVLDNSGNELGTATVGDFFTLISNPLSIRIVPEK
jgi:hypothetical protein